MRVFTALVLVLVLATSAMALEKKAFQMREDYGTEPLYSSYMNYFYYIPCPTYSWFWMYTNWAANDIIGVFYTVGDPSMSRTATGCPPYAASDPCNEQAVQYFRVLDFAGYGTIYPGFYTVEFDIYCSDADGCPVGASLWNSGPLDFCVGGWNYIYPAAPVNVCGCATDATCYPRFLIAAKMIGTDPIYPAWGMDNMSTPVQDGTCALHDMGCCPALYPRPYSSHYSTIHSGYYGVDFVNCPPYWFADGRDTTSGATLYGFIELAWRVYLFAQGPTATEPSTWGNIKAMYR
jgi:hypothetical protein